MKTRCSEINYGEFQNVRSINQFFLALPINVYNVL